MVWPIRSCLTIQSQGFFCVKAFRLPVVDYSQDNARSAMHSQKTKSVSNRILNVAPSVFLSVPKE